MVKQESPARWVTIVLASLAVAIAAAPAPAATPEAAATQQLAAAEKAARTGFKAALAAAQGQLATALANVELELVSAPSPTGPGDSLFDALTAFQTSVFVAKNLASNAQADAAKSALATLAPGLSGIYPDAFYPGDGTPTARFEAAIAKDAAKVYAKVSKRLAKLVAKFAAQGFALNVRLRPPVATEARSWSETLVDFITVLPPTIDLALAWSDLATLGDGQIRIAGSGTHLTGAVDNGPVLLGAFSHPGADVFVDGQAEPTGNRWLSSFGGETFVEGVYLLVAGQQLVSGQQVSIGLR
jgi:hypothetical protein